MKVLYNYIYLFLLILLLVECSVVITKYINNKELSSINKSVYLYTVVLLGFTSSLFGFLILYWSKIINFYYYRMSISINIISIFYSIILISNKNNQNYKDIFGISLSFLIIKMILLFFMIKNFINLISEPKGSTSRISNIGGSTSRISNIEDSTNRISNIGGSTSRISNIEGSTSRISNIGGSTSRITEDKTLRNKGVQLLEFLKPQLRSLPQRILSTI